MSIHFQAILLAVVLATAPEEQPQLQPQISVRSVSVDIKEMPAGHFDLISDARNLANVDREAYFRRLDKYIDEAYDCSRPDRMKWFLEFSYRTRQHDDVAAITGPLISKLILEDPRCFLAAVDRLEYTLLPNDAMRRFVFEPDDVSERQASIERTMTDSAFPVATEAYRTVRVYHEKQLAERERREKRREEYERRKYLARLADKDYLEKEPENYWRQWEEVTRNSRNCEDIRAITALLDAATLHVNEIKARENNAAFIESLLMRQPQCALHAMYEMRNHGVLVENYLFRPQLHSFDEIRTRLLYAPTEGDAEVSRQRIERQYRERRLKTSDGLPDRHSFIWSLKETYQDNNGGIYVAPNGRRDDTDRQGIEMLWAQEPDAGLRGEFDRSFKQLPIEKLEFVDRSDIGQYYLLQFGKDTVKVIRARVVGAALAEWYCGGVIPLLHLEPETPVDWIPSGRKHNVYTVIEIRDDLPAPEALDIRTDDRMFTHGRFLWPGNGRSLDFAYTSAYVGIEFRATDNQTGREIVSTRPAWDCH